MIAAREYFPKLTPAEYLDWEEHKFNLYRRSDSLQDYVLVDTQKIEIDLYSKNDLAEPTLCERGRWEILSYLAGDTIELRSIDLTFPIEQVFEDIVFDSELEG
jgi:Uma2 family endonuclease